MSFILVMPAFNEEAHIASVLEQLCKSFPVIVVDDGSEDLTAKIAEQAGAYVLRNEVNQGYDAAITSGIYWAINNRYKFAITIDADGQFAPSSAIKALRFLETGADLVVGVRQKYARWSEYIFSRYTKTKWGIDDPLCGLKGYNLSRLPSKVSTKKFDSVGTSLMVYLCKSNNVRIRQMPVNIMPRLSESRFGNSFKSEMVILRALFHTIFNTKTLETKKP